MSYYVELEFKVKNREKFLEILRKKWDFSGIPDSDQEVWYLPLTNKNNRTSILLMLHKDGTVTYDVSRLDEQHQVEEELLATVQDYILDSVQQIAAESGMAITGMTQYEDGKMEILLEDYA